MNCGLAISVVAVFLAGCPSPNVYGTARTLPKGESQHTFAFERFSTIGTFSNGSETSLPTYQYRYGVSDHADIGVRIANATSLGGDIKWNLLRGDIDVAVAPGFVGTYIAASDEDDSVALGLLHLQLPVLIGLRVNDKATFVLTPGAGIAVATAKATSGGAGRFIGDSTPFGRVGLGFNVRATPRFAIQPELTVMKYSGSQGQLLTLGVGFSFGTPPRSNDELHQLEQNRERATRFANDTIAAAAEGDCKTVARLAARVKEFDATVHRTLAADAGIAACFAEADHARLTAVHATYETCRQKRIEIARDAAHIENLKERGRVFMSMPVCGGAPPPVPDLETMTTRRKLTVDRLTKTAGDAARRGDCAIAKQLEPRAREIDVGLRDSVFVRDPEIARCLAVVRPTKPDPAPTMPDPRPTQPTPAAPDPSPQPTSPTAPDPVPPPATPPPQPATPTVPVTPQRTPPTSPDPVPPPATPPPVTPTTPQPATPPPQPATPTGVTPPPPPSTPTSPVRPTQAISPVPRPIADTTPDVVITAPILAEARRPFPRRTTAIVMGTTALVSMGVALWAGLDARSKRDLAREAGCSDDLSNCTSNGVALADEAHARGTLATVFLIGSGITATTAIVLWLTAPARTNPTAWRAAPTRGLGVVFGRGF
jgi:hypothetical protein